MVLCLAWCGIHLFTLRKWPWEAVKRRICLEEVMGRASEAIRAKPVLRSKRLTGGRGDVIITWHFPAAGVDGAECLGPAFRGGGGSNG